MLCSQGDKERKEQKTLPSPRTFQGTQKSCVRNWCQRPNSRTKDTPSAVVPWEITRVLRALCQELEAETIYVFSIISTFLIKNTIKIMFEETKVKLFNLLL